MRLVSVAFMLSFLAAPVTRALDGWPSNVTVVHLEKGKTVTTRGKLENGSTIANLDFASRSSVACFPATQNEKFRGHHVLFATQLQARSVVEITVTPDNPSQDLSIYAYTVGTQTHTLPPALSSCVSCEAEHRWDRPKRGRTQDHSRTVRLNAATHPYNVVIAVSGPAAATRGSFTLTLKTQ
jgi:hypothetical protein